MLSFALDLINVISWVQLGSSLMGAEVASLGPNQRGLTLNSNSTMKLDTLRGILLHSQPDSDGLSCVNRTCLLVFCTVSTYDNPSLLVESGIPGHTLYEAWMKYGQIWTHNDGVPTEVPPSIL